MAVDQTRRPALKRLAVAALRRVAKAGWVVVVGSVGLLFFWAGVWGISRSSAGFQPAEAEVLLVRPWVTSGDPTSSSRYSWFVSIGLHYSYAIGDRRYQGLGILDVVRTGSHSRAEELAAAAARRYAPGRPVRIYVDPDDPSRSTLERSPWWEALPVLFFGIILLFHAIGTAVLAVRGWLARRVGRPG